VVRHSLLCGPGPADSTLSVRIDPEVYKHLVAAANRHQTSTVVVEKAVDVALAVDLVRMADRNEYDVTYLLAADGDYTQAVKAVMETGKKVFAVALKPGAQLAAVVYKFIPLKRDWLTDCFGASLALQARTLLGAASGGSRC
jgi:uncharacterized LabA/DUF88 family protein